MNLELLYQDVLFIGHRVAYMTIRHSSCYRFCRPTQCADAAFAVCVSDTLMYCAQTTESIVMRSSPDCSPAPNMNPIARENFPR